MSTYNDVKNYVHNELGITKEYVDNLIREAVVTEIHKILNDEPRIKRVIEDEIVRCCKIYNQDGTRRSFVISVMDDIYNKIDRTIHEEVRKRLIVELRDSNEISND